MQDFLISSLIHALSVVGGFPTRLTDRSRIEALLERLYPRCSGKELLRLGPRGDGGYLVPDDLEGIQACFSPGVSNQSGFEKDCAELGMKVFLADRSVEGPAVDHALFSFTKKFVGATSNHRVMTLDHWVASAQLEENSDLLLQIDIEGHEYEVFLAAQQRLMERFRIIVAEFHRLDHLWSRPFFDLVEPVFDKILQTHACVHLHPNNRCGSLRRGGLDIPPTMEFTFLRKDRMEQFAYQTSFPHPLDCDNSTDPSLPLPACWYADQGAIQR